MTYSLRGEAKRTQAAKGAAMGVTNEYMPAKAARMTGEAAEKTVAPPASVWAPQFPEDKTIPSATPQSWITGAGESAESKPGFDRGD